MKLIDLPLGEEDYKSNSSIRLHFYYSVLEIEYVVTQGSNNPKAHSECSVLNGLCSYASQTTSYVLRYDPEIIILDTSSSFSQPLPSSCPREARCAIYCCNIARKKDTQYLIREAAPVPQNYWKFELSFLLFVHQVVKSKMIHLKWSWGGTTISNILKKNA